MTAAATIGSTVAVLQMQKMKKKQKKKDLPYPALMPVQQVFFRINIVLSKI
ncbi:MAG: hypothetical protein ACI4ET_14535 [Bilifractor sp.]|nr:hypothetical protein [Eubacterium sp.]